MNKETLVVPLRIWESQQRRIRTQDREITDLLKGFSSSAEEKMNSLKRPHTLASAMEWIEAHCLDDQNGKKHFEELNKYLNKIEILNHNILRTYSFYISWRAHWSKMIDELEIDNERLLVENEELKNKLSDKEKQT